MISDRSNSYVKISKPDCSLFLRLMKKNEYQVDMWGPSYVYGVMSKYESETCYRLFSSKEGAIHYAKHTWELMCEEACECAESTREEMIRDGFINENISWRDSTLPMYACITEFSGWPEIQVSRYDIDD